MASILPSPSDCCDDCVCNVVSVDICPDVSGGGSFLVVENTSALRLVLSPQRTEHMLVQVLTDVGTPNDGTGYFANWYPDDLTPDAPPLSVRPADVPGDGDPGRFKQSL